MCCLFSKEKKYLTRHSTCPERTTLEENMEEKIEINKKKCKRCGKEFIPNWKTPETHVYCSRSCGAMSYRDRSTVPRKLVEQYSPETLILIDAHNEKSKLKF